METREKVTAVAEWVARVVVAVVFAYAGAVKACDPAEFVRSIERYRLLPYPAAVVLGLLLPWLEIVAAAALLRPRLRAGGLALLGACSLSFLGAIASAMLRGLDIECGCFGSGSGGGSLASAAVRSAGLAVACAWLLRVEWQRAGEKFF